MSNPNQESYCPKCPEGAKGLLVEKPSGMKCPKCGHFESWKVYNRRIQKKAQDGFTTTYKQVANTPPFNDREKFCYIFTALATNPVVMGLPLERRDEILKQMIKKFCPSIDNAQWYILFHGCENLREPLTNYLREITTFEEQMNITTNFEKLVGDQNYGAIREMAEKIHDKMKKP